MGFGVGSVVSACAVGLLCNDSNESFYVSDIPASDFVITQAKDETKLDYCSLLIKKTVFCFGGVKNCRQLKEYIQENYN